MAPRSATEIFLTFARIGASGFGGVNFWIRRIIIQEKGWVTDEEYLEGLALGQILPGPNAYNLSVMLGYRFGGLRGAFAAITGLLGPPLAFMIALGLLYQRYADVPILERALTGMSAVAAGLLLANAVGIATALPKRFLPWFFLALAFVGTGILRWPLLYVMAGLAPFAMASARSNH
ncbi:MAG TPA: chromate transporter [Burkholderiales bacterium]|nr:chromate transporter [Burkholderiales bacterium]